MFTPCSLFSYPRRVQHRCGGLSEHLDLSVARLLYPQWPLPSLCRSLPHAPRACRAGSPTASQWPCLSLHPSTGEAPRPAPSCTPTSLFPSSPFLLIQWRKHPLSSQSESFYMSKASQGSWRLYLPEFSIGSLLSACKYALDLST